MKIYFVRHAETIGNKMRILQGHSDFKLTELGQKQIKMISNRLKNVEFEAIYSSDTGRAAKTAKGIAEQHQGTPIYFTDELRERNLGSFECKDIEKIDWQGWETKWPIDVETNKEMLERAYKFMLSIKGKHEGNILIVTHAQTKKALMQAVLGEEMFKEEIKIGNTSLSIINKGSLELLNSIDHLE